VNAGDERGTEAAPGAARRGPTWVILAVVAAALVVCCCSVVIGVALSWSAGLFGGR
jgi:putative Ca2+/H+ antiporter (TMEM165/GDT1 family)